MPIDVVGRRLSAAERIRDKGMLLSIRQPIYAGGVRTGWDTTIRTWCVIESTRPFPLSEDVQMGTEKELLIAALRWDEATATWGTPFVLGEHDQVSLDGSRWLSVFLPGDINPSGEAIVFEPRVGLRKTAGAA